MKAVEQIRDWFLQQETEIQKEIAALIFGYLDYDIMKEAMSADDPSEFLVNWLVDDNDFPYRAVGKAVSFVHVFEHVFGKRFSAASWEDNKEFFEKVLKDAPDEGIAKTAKKMLSDIPRRQALWGGVGASWSVFREELTYEEPILERSKVSETVVA